MDAFKVFALMLLAGILLNCCSQLDMMNGHLREIAAHIDRR